MSPSLDPRLGEIISSHQGLEGPLLPILHAVQAEWGHIPDFAHQQIADALNLTRAEVYGVVTFYHDFKDKPGGRHHLKLCRAEACQAMGADALADQARARLGLDWHQTSADGRVTLEPVFCLGLCAIAPAAQIDGHGVARVDAARLDALIDEVLA